MAQSTAKIVVSTRIEFSCCYIYQESEAPSLNSHRYKFEATVEGLQKYEDSGRIIDFQDLTQVCKWSVPDKAFVYNDDRNSLSFEIANTLRSHGLRCVGYPFEFSTEQFINAISLKLISLLAMIPGVRLLETKLREDSNSFVSWTNTSERN